MLAVDYPLNAADLVKQDPHVFEATVLARWDTSAELYGEKREQLAVALQLAVP